METRVALLSIIVHDPSPCGHPSMRSCMNMARFIIGRMGLPYREKGIHIISIAMDAPQDKISALAGKIGKIPGITSRATYANMGDK